METKSTESVPDSGAESEKPSVPTGETASAEARRRRDVESLRELLHSKTPEECLRSMSPERKALYERIIKRRDAIGPLDFDIVETLREIRNNG